MLQRFLCQFDFAILRFLTDWFVFFLQIDTLFSLFDFTFSCSCFLPSSSMQAIFLFLSTDYLIYNVNLNLLIIYFLGFSLHRFALGITQCFLSIDHLINNVNQIMLLYLLMTSKLTLVSFPTGFWLCFYLIKIICAGKPKTDN